MRKPKSFTECAQQIILESWNHHKEIKQKLIVKSENCVPHNNAYPVSNVVD